MMNWRNVVENSHCLLYCTAQHMSVLHLVWRKCHSEIKLYFVLNLICFLMYLMVAVESVINLLMKWHYSLTVLLVIFMVRLFSLWLQV